MLLTALLSSACSLAVPSAAQKHFASGGDQHGPLPAPSTTLASSSFAAIPIVRPAHPAAVATQTLLHQHHPDRKQHGHRRPVDPAHGSAEQGSAGEEAHPDLYNLTLTAMRQYLRNHLNASRFGKAPRKRSHVHVDAVDVEFYRRFKEFNSSQAVLDGVPSHLASAGTNSTQLGPESSLVPAVKDASDADQPVEPLAIVTNVTPEPSPVTSSSAAPSAGTGQRDYSVLMDDPRGYIIVSSSFPLRPGKTSTTWNTTFAQHRGYIYGLVSFSVICALVLGLFGVFRCLRATTTTRATTEALTLPIQFIADDLAPLNANLNHLPVPMLSVQSPGCAGMERLGVPARGSIGSPPIRNERAGFHHQQQAQQQQSQQQQHQHQQQQSHPQQHQPSNQQNHHRHHHHQYHQQTSPTDQHLRFSSDLILSSSTSSNFRSNHNQSYLLIPHQPSAALGGSGGGGGSSGSNSINYKTHYSNSSYGGSSSIGSTGTTNPITTSFPHCTYHVPLPDGEYGPDRDLQIRTPCQQSEIPRTYVKAPPNKTVRDVPVQYQSTGGITTHGTTVTAGIGTGHPSSMVDLASYYGGAKTIGRPVDGGRLAATAPGPSLGGSATCQQKSVDKLQKIFRFLPGKATKSSTPSSSASSASSSSSSSSSSSTSSSSGSSKGTSNTANNNHQGANAASYGGLQPPAHPGVLPASHSTSTGSLNNNNNNGSGGGSTVAGGSIIASGSVISSISGSYGPNSVSSSIGCSNHVNNNRVGCGSAGGNIRVDGRGGLSLATAGAGIHNHNQHYRSPPVAVSSLGSPSAATLSSPTSSSSSSASSSSSSPSPLASTVVRQSGVDVIVPGTSTTGPIVSGSSSDPGHAPFTM